MKHKLLDQEILEELQLILERDSFLKKINDIEKTSARLNIFAYLVYGISMISITFLGINLFKDFKNLYRSKQKSDAKLRAYEFLTGKNPKLSAKELESLIKKGLDINYYLLTSQTGGNWRFYKNTLLQKAIELNNLEMVSFLTKHPKIKFNIIKNKLDQNALLSAITRGNYQMVCLLLETQKISNQSPTEIFDCLSEAIKNNHIEIVRLFLTKYKWGDGDKSWFLREAIQLKNIEIVQLLIDGLAWVNEDNLKRIIELDNFEIIKSLFTSAEKSFYSSVVSGQTCIHFTVEEGKFEMVKWFLANGVDVNLKNTDNNTLLYTALSKNNNEIANFLLNQPGVDLNVRNLYGVSLLHMAAWKGDVEVLRVLLDKVTNFVGLNSDFGNLLHSAASGGNVEIIDLLFKKINLLHERGLITDQDRDNAIGFHFQNQRNQTPVQYAVARKNLEMVQWFLDNGLDVNFQSEGGNTILHTALLFKNNNAVIKLILEQPNVDLNVRNENGQSLVHIVARRGNVEIFKLLLAKEVNLLGPNPDSGDNLLHAAVKGGNVEIIDLLFNKVNSLYENNSITLEDRDNAIGFHFQNQRNKTPVQLIVEAENLEMVQWFLDKGLDVDFKDSYGRTMLCNAFCNDNSKMAQLLLSYNANPNIQNDRGNTFAHIIVSDDNLDWFKLFLQHGADLKIRNNSGESVFDKLKNSLNCKEFVKSLSENNLVISVFKEILPCDFRFNNLKKDFNDYLSNNFFKILKIGKFHKSLPEEIMSMISKHLTIDDIKLDLEDKNDREIFELFKYQKFYEKFCDEMMVSAEGVKISEISEDRLPSLGQETQKQLLSIDWY